MNNSEKLLKLTVVSGLAAFLVFISFLTIYLGNLRDYSFTLPQLCVVGGIVGLGIFFFVFLSLICVFCSRYYSNFFLFYFALAICIYVQSNMLLWSLGGDNTTIHSMSNHPIYGTIELLIWGGIFFFVYRFKDLFLKYFVSISIVLFLAPVLAIAPSILNYREDSLNKILDLYSDVPEQIHCISEKENVFIVLLDSMEQRYFQKVLDSAPSEMNELLKDFEYFPRFLSLYPQTFYAVPTLLSGDDYFDKNKKWDIHKTVFEQTESNYFNQTYIDLIEQMYRNPNALLVNTDKAGFRNELYPLAGTAVYLPKNLDIVANIDYSRDQKAKRRVFSLNVLVEKIIPCGFYRISPLILKPVAITASNNVLRELYKLYSGESWDPETIQTKEQNETVTSVDSAKNQSQNDIDINALLNSDRYFFNIPDKCQVTSEKYFKFIHLNGLHCLDSISNPQWSKPEVFGKVYFIHGIRKYLEYLKQNQCYNSSWIIFLGDHGMHSSPVSQQFNPILLVKRPQAHQDKMLINNDVILMRDIAPSLLQELGIKTQSPFSLWHQTTDQKEERNLIWEEYVTKNIDVK